MSDVTVIPHVVTVCTVVRDDTQHLGRFLEAMDDQSLPVPGFDVVVVDATTSGITAELVSTQRVCVEVVRVGASVGHGEALNAGWRAAHGEGIAFLAADVVPVAIWVEYLARALRRGRRLVSGRWLPTKGSLPDSGPLSFRIWAVAREASLTSTDQLGCGRADLERVGGFDESIADAGACDLDLAIRLVESGVDPMFSRWLVCSYDIGAVPLAEMIAARRASGAAVVALANRPGARARLLAGGVIRPGAQPRALLAVAGLLLMAKDRRAVLLTAPWWHERTCVTPHAAGPRRKRFVAPGVLAFDFYDALIGLAARIRSAPRT